MGGGRPTGSLEQGGFLLFLALVSAALIAIVLPFARSLLWAALAAIMFQPLYRWVLRKVRGKRNLAATLTLAIIFVAVLLPAMWIGSLVVEETINLINSLRDDPPPCL